MKATPFLGESVFRNKVGRGMYTGRVQARGICRRWTVFLGCLGLFFLICRELPAQEVQPQGTGGGAVLRIAGGEPGWAYWRYAEEIERILEDGIPGVEVRLVKTGGSAESLNLLVQQKVELAIIQNNAAYGSKVSPERVRGLSSLFTEAVQVFGVNHTPMETSADLHGLNIFVGERGSGTFEDARRTLNLLGVMRTEYEPVMHPIRDLHKFIGSNQIDAGILVDSVPSADILFFPSPARLLSFSPAEIRDLLGEYSYLVPYTIPSGTYPGQRENVETVGIRALLVCNASFEDEWVNTLLGGMVASTHLERLSEEYGGEWSTPIMSSRGMTFPVHPAAKRFYRFRVFFQQILGQWLPDLVLMAGVILFWSGIWFSRKAFFRAVRSNLALRLMAIFGSIYVMSTSAIHLAEQNRTPGFNSLTESFWSTAVYVLSGLESREPRTMAGKIGLTVLLFASLGLLGSITGKFASIFIHNRRRVMPKDISKHIVICNWNTHGDKIIRELHAGEAAPDTDIVVVTREDVPEDELRSATGKRGEDFYSRVYFVKSDPQLTNVLKSARAQLARCVMILIDETSPDPDANSAIIALALQEVFRNELKEGAVRPYVVAESANHRKIPHLKGAGVNEVVCAEDYGVGILSQCALYHRLSEVYDRLLHYTEDSNELYVVDEEKLPAWLTGKTYKEISLAVQSNRDPGNPCIPLGLQRQNGDILLNPRGEDHDVVFEKGDRLIAIAFNPPDFSHLEPNNKKEDFPKKHTGSERI